MLGDCPAAISAFYHDHVDVADTGVFRLRDCGVTGAGMAVRGDVLLASNHLGHSVAHCHEQLASGRLGALSSYARRSVGRAVVLLGAGYDVYGHWLVDIIPKLYALHRVGLDPAGLMYLIPADTKPFGHAWLTMVGIRPEQLLAYDPHGEIVVAEELIVPTLLRFGSRAAAVFRDAVGFMMAAMAARAGPARAAATPESIFVSRARAGRDGRTMRNRGEVEAIAADHGYSIVHPEQMSLDEQVVLFRGARRIVGEYGSAMHTAIFAPPGAMLCCLRGAARHPAFLQSGLAQVLDQECGYVLGDAPLEAYEYEFAIAAEDFQRALRLMALPRQ